MQYCFIYKYNIYKDVKNLFINLKHFLAINFRTKKKEKKEGKTKITLS